MENAELRKHLRTDLFNDRLVSPSGAASLIRDGMTVALSGFTPSGTPKAIPAALAEQVRSGSRSLKITLLSGASTGEEVDSSWADLGIIARRLPYMTSKPLRTAINKKPEAAVCYLDQHLGAVAQNARYGFYGSIDLAVIEAAAITEEGHIIPSTAVGCTQTFVDLADKVLIELNLTQPVELEGFHDIVRLQDPPERKPVPLTSVNGRIGVPYISCTPEKIAAVVITENHENPRLLASPDETSKRIAGHIIDFLMTEKSAGRLSADRVPLQSGVGSVANAVLLGLQDSPLDHLSFFSEVIQDGIIALIDSGKADTASATSLTMSEAGMQHFLGNLEKYRGKVILRDSEVSNNAEVIRRLGVISINTAIEADIYGNINSSHMFGTDIYNGIGGSGDYTRNASVSVFITPSTAKGGKISSIVPMVSHVDHTEHDVDVLVTEEGYADLRGLSPKERAQLIIQNCAHPLYRPLLSSYFRQACEECDYSQTPHLLGECFSFHTRYKQTGTMLPDRKDDE